ncbi:hypothetical protein QFZ70_001492 [Arthrobacter sp. V1I9]|uniref:hypothetical protein n=1 Tax=Arthrobacter sp. V1I9 TaxID=3042275 RepID=UPI002791734E|nr:hypothetical protein [Arthrobacter sp. V1I9]MDQ0869019.1 hypothetical protein [Arthrobacter sp. V1I9]
MIDLEAAAKSPSKLRQLHLLGEIYRLSEEWGRLDVPTAGLYNEGHEWGIDVSALRGDLKALLANGWIYTEVPSGKIPDVRLEQAGIDVALEYKRVRSNPRQRASALKPALINWLYDQYLAGEEPKDFTSFKAEPEGSYLGLAYTDDEITRTAKWLKDKGYIQAWTPINGKVMSPRITASGIHIVELTESAGSAPKPEGMIVNNNFNIRDSHSMNFALNSPGAVQSNTLTTEQLNEAAKVATAFRQMLPILGVPDEKHEEAQQVIADLEEEVSAAEPKQGRIKNLLFKSLELVALGTAGGAADALGAMTQSAIDGLV